MRIQSIVILGDNCISALKFLIPTIEFFKNSMSRKDHFELDILGNFLREILFSLYLCKLFVCCHISSVINGIMGCKATKIDSNEFTKELRLSLFLEIDKFSS